MINWREWLYAKLIADTELTSLVSTTSIFGAGSLTQTPKDKPFIVLSFGPEIPMRVSDTTQQDGKIWVHDSPGNYLRIGLILARLRAMLVGQVSDSNGLVCRWQGDSPDLADDGYGTITKNASFLFIGRNESGE